MKNLFRLFTFLILGFTLFITSCDKERDEEETTPPTPSDFTTTTISGVVYDESHYILDNVDITVGNTTLTTGWDGSFLLKNVTVNKNRFLVKFNKANYFETVKTEKTISGGITRLDVTMISKASADNTTITPSVGGDLVIVGGGNIHFPAGLNYVDADGNAYTGNVNIHAKFLDPTDENYSRLVPGGDQFGVLTTGAKSTKAEEDVYLLSVGGIIVELTDDGGNIINLDPVNDSLVTIDTPIPFALQATAPDTIDSWYSGGDMAYSSNEGSGRKEGGKYISQVEHFSFWSLEIPYTGNATIKGRVTDDAGNSIPGLRVRIGQSYAVTDNDGYYERVVPAGVPGITVQVMPIDFNNYSSSAYVQSALSDGQTQTVDIIVTIPVGDMIVVTGRLVGCSGTPIAGNVFAYQNTYTINTYTQDGSFSILVPVTWTGFYLKCSASGTTKDVYVSPTSNPYDIGDIIICPPPANSNEITIDGTTYGDFNVSNSHFYTAYTQLYIDVSGTNRSFYFYIDNCTQAGTYQITVAKSVKTGGDVNIDGTYYTIDSGSITISEYGDVHGRIIGTFSLTGSNGEVITGKFNSFREEDQVAK